MWQWAEGRENRYSWLGGGKIRGNGDCADGDDFDAGEDNECDNFDDSRLTPEPLSDNNRILTGVENANQV